MGRVGGINGAEAAHPQSVGRGRGEWWSEWGRQRSVDCLDVGLRGATFSNGIRLFQPPPARRQQFRSCRRLSIDSATATILMMRPRRQQRQQQRPHRLDDADDKAEMRAQLHATPWPSPVSSSCFAAAAAAVAIIIIIMSTGFRPADGPGALNADMGLGNEDNATVTSKSGRLEMISGRPSQACTHLRRPRRLAPTQKGALVNSRLHCLGLPGGSSARRSECPARRRAWSISTRRRIDV